MGHLPQEICQKSVAAHRKWKAAFREFMKGAIDFDPEQVKRNDMCALGQWLESEGRQLLEEEEFTLIYDYHSIFHQIAAQVVQLKLQGNAIEAWAMIEANSRFTQISTQLINLLESMCDECSHKP